MAREMNCSITTIVHEPRSSASAPKRGSTTPGASPCEISSMISNRGGETTILEMASICCSPPERFPAGSLARAFNTGNRAYAASIRWRTMAPFPSRWNATRRLSRTVSPGNTARKSGSRPMPSRTRRSGRSRPTGVPSTTIDPDAAGTSPISARARVDFPAPFGPSTARTLPGSTSRWKARRAATPPYSTDRSLTESPAGMWSRPVSSTVLIASRVRSPFDIGDVTLSLVASEVSLLHGAQCQYFCGTTVRDHRTEVEGDETIGGSPSEIQIVLHHDHGDLVVLADLPEEPRGRGRFLHRQTPVSYTHLRAHETRHDLVCRLLLEKKK